jgi:hypothetical protein
MASGDEPIAAVVAGPAQHGDRSATVVCRNRCRDRSSSGFHEPRPGNTASNGGGICFGHLGASQQDQIVAGAKIAHWAFAVQD